MGNSPEEPTRLLIDLGPLEGFCWEGVTVRAHLSPEEPPRVLLLLESSEGSAEVSLTRDDTLTLIDQLREALAESEL